METGGTIADDKATQSARSDKRQQRMALLATAVAAAVFVAIASLFVFHGKPNADEGFYAVIAHEVMQGKLLYRDLAYTQTPLLPYIQGAAMSLIGFGVGQQRWLNVSFQAITLALVVYYLVRRRLSLTLAVGLIAAWCLCIPLLYFGTIGKTYALAQLFLVIAGLCVVGAFPPRLALVILSLSGVFSVGCRLTVAPCVLVLWIGFMRIHATIISRTLLFTTPLLFTILFFGPFFAAAPTNAYFWMWDYHQGSMIPAARLANLMQLPFFAPGITLIAILGIIHAFSHHLRNQQVPALWVLTAGVAGAIINVGATGIYLEYAAPCLGLIVLGTGASFLSTTLSPRYLLIGAMLSLALSFATFYFQDRSWSKEDYLGDVANAGQYIARQSTPDDLLITSMPELGLAAERPLYPRSEMGKFAVTAEMSPQQAFNRRIISFGELVFTTQQRLPKMIALSRAVRWNFHWSVPSLGVLKDEYYGAFASALDANYNCTYSNGSFLVFSRKAETSPTAR